MKKTDDLYSLQNPAWPLHCALSNTHSSADHASRCQQRGQLISQNKKYQNNALIQGQKRTVCKSSSLYPLSTVWWLIYIPTHSQSYPPSMFQSRMLQGNSCNTPSSTLVFHLQVLMENRDSPIFWWRWAIQKGKSIINKIIDFEKKKERLEYEVWICFN